MKTSLQVLRCQLLSEWTGGVGVGWVGGGGGVEALEVFTCDEPMSDEHIVSRAKLKYKYFISAQYFRVQTWFTAVTLVPVMSPVTRRLGHTVLLFSPSVLLYGLFSSKWNHTM